jgi:virulence-associated protein VagC
MATTAKTSEHRRSQGSRLPKGFRLPDDEVRVSRVGHEVILEPLEPIDVEAWRAEFVAGGAKELLTEGLSEHEPPTHSNDVSFD